MKGVTSSTSSRSSLLLRHGTVQPLLPSSSAWASAPMDLRLPASPSHTGCDLMNHGVYNNHHLYAGAAASLPRVLLLRMASSHLLLSSSIEADSFLIFVIASSPRLHNTGRTTSTSVERQQHQRGAFVGSRNRVRRDHTLEDLALPLGMSFVGVLSQVSGGNVVSSDQLPAEILFMVCTSGVKESASHINGSRFQCNTEGDLWNVKESTAITEKDNGEYVEIPTVDLSRMDISDARNSFVNNVSADFSNDKRFQSDNVYMQQHVILPANAESCLNEVDQLRNGNF